MEVLIRTVAKVVESLLSSMKCVNMVSSIDNI